MFRLLLLLFLAVLLPGCSANDNVLRSGKETPASVNAEGGKTTFAADLDAMRTAGFRYIYVLRRMDGGKMDAEDRGVIKLQTADANRRVAADEERAVIVGSNFQISPKNMTALYDRFALENYSSTIDYGPPPTAANTNK